MNEKEFCKWLARKVIELDNDGAIVEIVCRKLWRMGYLNITETAWTLPFDEEEEDERIN